MWLADYIGLVILLVIWAATLFRLKIGGGRLLLLGAVVIMVGVLAYASGQQYRLWQENEISKFLLPPHAPINYFVFYAFTRIWISYIVSLIAGLIILSLANYYNRRHGEKFFWSEEPYFLALGLFLAGHPGWILYIVLSLIAYTLWLLVHTLRLKRNERFSFYYLWLPLAAVTIVLDAWLLQFDWYGNLLI